MLRYTNFNSWVKVYFPLLGIVTYGNDLQQRKIKLKEKKYKPNNNSI